jgi:hypothetical protein
LACKNEEILMREEINGLEQVIAQKQFRIAELEEQLQLGKA